MERTVEGDSQLGQFFAPIAVGDIEVVPKGDLDGVRDALSLEDLECVELDVVVERDLHLDLARIIGVADGLLILPNFDQCLSLNPRLLARGAFL